MKQKIAIFYHILQINHWQDLFEQQFNSLQESGLLDAASYVHLGINGSVSPTNDLTKINAIKKNLKNYSEADTLTDLYKFCAENEDYKVLYLHTKGVTYPKSNHHQFCWLTYMDYFNVKNWRKCEKLLGVYDCVGTDWTTYHPDLKTNVPPHYSGNFWWANASYIKTLDLSYLYSDENNLEFWVGTGNPKYYNFYSSNKNKYTNAIIPQEYGIYSVIGN